MRDISDCKVYGGTVSKLTKANSVVVDGRVIRITKKDYTGKASKSYIAYDSSSNLQLASHHDKDTLIGFLLKQDMSVLGIDKQSLF